MVNEAAGGALRTPWQEADPGGELRLVPGNPLDREAATLLAQFCRDERPEQFRRLFDRTAPRLLPLLRLMLRKHRSPLDPRELLTDTFAQIFRARESFRKDADGSFVRWFLTIAQNQLRQGHRADRRRDRREQHAARSIHDQTTNPFTCLVREEARHEARRTCHELKRLVLEGLEHLSAPYRQVLLLHTVHGLKYRQIAERLGLSTSGVAMRMKRARERILLHVTESIPPVGPPEVQEVNHE